MHTRCLHVASKVLSGMLAATLAAAGAAAALPTSSEELWAHVTERHDLDDNGIITAEEFAQSDPRFLRLDGNGDGVVTIEDMDALQSEIGAAVGGRVVQLADSDRDRAVSSEEWTAFLEALDPDGDGLFDAADLAAMRPGRGGRGFGRPGAGPSGGGPFDSPRQQPEGVPNRGERIASRLDVDADGLLEIEDLDSIFEDLDADGDGSLQSDELPDRGFGHRGRGRGFGGGRGR